MTEEFMRVEDAIEIVLDLARQNVLEDCDDEDQEAEQKRQETAIGVIEDFATNVIAEGRVPTGDDQEALGQEYLDLIREAAATENPQSAIAMHQRLTEIEATLLPSFLAGLHIGADWAFNQVDEPTIGGWSVDDVISCGRQDCGVGLTTEQANVILQKIENDMDASVGINWTTIEFAINEWLSEHQGEAAPYSEDEDA